MAVQVTVYSDHVRVEEYSKAAHREEELGNSTGDRLAEQVLDWCRGADEVYVSQHGDDAAGLYKTVLAAVKKGDSPVKTSGHAKDSVVGDVPYRGRRVIRPVENTTNKK